MICGTNTSTPPTPPITASAEHAGQPGAGDVRGDQPGEPAEERLDVALQRRRQREDGLEEQHHDGEEHDRAPQRVQQHGVDPLGARCRPAGR